MFVPILWGGSCGGVRSVAQTLDCVDMLRSGIACVVLPAVSGILARKLRHTLVTVGFGQNRRGGNACISSIAMHNRSISVAVEGRESVAVDQQEIRPDFQGAHRPLHAGDAGLENVDTVDLFRLHRHHGPGERFFFDDGAQSFAGRAAHLLGVVQQRVMKTRRQNYRGSIYRTCQGPASRLVAAGFETSGFHITEQIDFGRHNTQSYTKCRNSQQGAGYFFSESTLTIRALMISMRVSFCRERMSTFS